jgi:hypothetical protein
MKNLLTDKPTPITVALGQKKAAGVPIIVNPVIMQNTEGDANLGLHMLVGPDEVSVAKKKAAAKKPASFAEIESSEAEED